MPPSAPPIPRVELAYAPTPLLKLERLSAELDVELWVKRDDLTGLLETGNKIRKLEFLVGEALAQRADTLITCGTLQSNCCRAVSAVAVYAALANGLPELSRLEDLRLPQEIVVLDRTGPPALAQAAAESLRKARFRPAEGDGGRQRSRVTLRVDFSYE